MVAGIAFHPDPFPPEPFAGIREGAVGAVELGAFFNDEDGIFAETEFNSVRTDVRVGIKAQFTGDAYLLSVAERIARSGPCVGARWNNLVRIARHGMDVGAAFQTGKHHTRLVVESLLR